MPRQIDRNSESGTFQPQASAGFVSRRDSLRSALGLVVAPIALGMAPPIRGVRSFQLSEPTGLRRFGYPVHALVPDAAAGRNFRLVRDGRAIPAQFRTVEGPGDRKEIALDFIASPGPLETDRYEVHFGPEVEPGPEPRGGLKLERRDGRFFISQGGSMTFEVAEDLSGFLRSVGSPRLGYLKKEARGLILRTRGAKSPASLDQADERSTPIRSRVTREGPFAVGLTFEWSGPHGISSTVDLTIPQSKSWVQVAWKLEDPSGRIDGLELDLGLELEGTPTLVDFGAGSTVYGQIKGGERMELLAGRTVGEPSTDVGPGWVVRRGEGESSTILASSAPGSPRPAEGWAHAMDSRRCTALAVADFGRSKARDRISVEANGRLRLDRDFSAGGASAIGPKSLAFWLHFVPMPVQIGAATSPQSILSPLRVEWDRPPS